MTTLAQLADICQRQLADETGFTWSQETVEAWVLEAIRDISQHFPRVREARYTLTAQVHEYDLPNDFVDALLVEYPDGEDPPAYLTRLARTDPDFWSSDDYYDIYPGGQLSDPDVDELEVGLLILSAAPSTGEHATLAYSAEHDSALDPTDTVTIAQRLHGVVVTYVVWRAWVERVAVEEQNPDATVLLLSQLASNADRAHRRYTEALNRARGAHTEAELAGPWRVDPYDRVY
jgi:hypothetical protein